MELVVQSVRRKQTKGDSYELPPFLSYVDALRVCAIVEKSIEKLQLLSMLTTDVSSLHMDTVVEQDQTHNQSNIVAKILEEQRKLGARYEVLSQQRSNKDQDVLTSLKEQQEKEAELAQIQEKLKDNTRKLCRNLKETPNEMNNWKKVQSERTEIQNILSNCLRELQNGLLPQSKYKQLKNVQSTFNNSLSQRPEVSYEFFFKKVKDEIRDRQQLQTLQEQEVQLNKIVKSLHKEVKKEKEMKRFEVEERTQRVNELVNQLRELKKITNEVRMKAEATDDAEFQCRRRQEQIELQKLEQELLEEEMKLKIEEKVYEQTTEFLSKKNQVLVQKGTEWKDKSDREIEEMRQKLSYWEGIREDQINLKNKLEEKYMQEMEEMKIRARVKDARIEQDRLDRERELYDSATRIKLCFRSYKARLLYEQLKTEKAKSKKKKKSDKKK